MLYQRGISVAISAGDLPLAVEFVESRRAQHLAHRTALHPSQLSSQPDTLQNKNDADVATSRQRYTTFVERRRALQSALHEVWFGDSPKTVEQMARLREALEQQRLAYGELNAHAMPCHAMPWPEPLPIKVGRLMCWRLRVCERRSTSALGVSGRLCRSSLAWSRKGTGLMRSG